MKKLLALSVPFLLLVGAQNLWAAASHRVNNGAVDQLIDEWSTCHLVSNSSGIDYFVPTNTSAEWAAFRANLPTNVTLGACPACDTTITNMTTDGTYTVPALCTGLVIKAWGGGGGGGAGVRGASGGAGGEAYSNSITVSGGDTFTITIGQGGLNGSCTTASGGGGAHTGGAGAANSNGGVGGGSASGGAGGTSTYNGGAGNYGGGAGGSETTGKGGGGGGSTSVYNDQTTTTILIAGGGGAGGGSDSGGLGVAGAGAPGCAQAGSNGSSGRGGGGGGGDCLGDNEVNGSGSTPANSTEVGVGFADGGIFNNCTGTGDGGPGKVIFEPAI